MIDILKPLIRQFLPFAQEKMGFSRPPKLFLRQDQQNAANPMGKTGFYDPQDEAITLYISGRHPKDIMRSLAHELQHHTQKCNGDFDNVTTMGEEGYAQADPHMRTMEIQAYQASIVFRDWEDSTKGTIYYEHLQKGDNVSMSTKNWKNRELNGLLMERFGFDFNPLAEKLEEGFEKPKTATGAGPSNKGGKIERSDVANKDTSDFGEGGSASGGKPSAGGTNTAPKAGKMDRTDIANKATGRWLKEEEDLGEGLDDQKPGSPGYKPAAKKESDDDEDLEEQAAKRQGNEDRDVGRDRMHADRMHEVVMKLHKAGLTKNQIKESLTRAFNKAKKG